MYFLDFKIFSNALLKNKVAKPPYISESQHCICDVRLYYNYMDCMCICM